MIRINSLKIIVVIPSLYFCIQAINADVITDGSLGQVATLRGSDIQIEASLGKQEGGNLFHSFSEFSLDKMQTASFNGSNSVNNIIGRVTGGKLSNIDGTIHSSIPKANIYLVNPNGIIFGENAKLDIQGSFYGSTADYIELKDGSKYYSNPVADSVLSSAPPVAFGFLSDNPATLKVQSRNITMKTNQSFTLVGGDIDISIDGNGKGINAGNIALFSVGASKDGTGKVYFSDNQFTASNINKLGTINLHGFAKLRANATGSSNAGNILIQAGQLNILGGAQINSDSRGTGEAGQITLKADVIKMENSIVSSASYADGNGGSINIVTNSLQMQGASFIDTSTYGGIGNAGNITVNSPTLIMNDNASNITVNTLTLIMKDDASIITVAHQDSTGNAGNITITAKDINITGRGNGKEKSALISSNTTRNSKGQGGEINIITDTLSLYRDATIGVTSKGTGNAGNIYIDVGLKFSAENGYILSQGQTADGGNIEITADILIDLQQSQIKTNAIGKGGNISLKTALFILDQSQINASSTDSTGGNIDLEIDTYIRSKELGSSINATGVIDGLITISSPEIDLGKVLKNLNVDLLTNSVKDPCSIQVVSDESYLAINKNRGCRK